MQRNKSCTLSLMTIFVIGSLLVPESNFIYIKVVALLILLIGILGIYHFLCGEKGVFDLGMPVFIAHLLKKLSQRSSSPLYRLAIRVIRMVILVALIRTPTSIISLPFCIILSRHEPGTLKRLQAIIGFYSPTFQQRCFDPLAAQYDADFLDHNKTKGLRFRFAVDLLRNITRYSTSWVKRQLRLV